MLSVIKLRLCSIIDIIDVHNHVLFLTKRLIYGINDAGDFFQQCLRFKLGDLPEHCLQVLLTQL